jgi:hypothetical protein
LCWLKTVVVSVQEKAGFDPGHVVRKTLQSVRLGSGVGVVVEASKGKLPRSAGAGGSGGDVRPLGP